MMSKEIEGASSLGEDRATQAAPEAPSGLRRSVSVPSAGDYVIWRDWGLNFREIAQVTPKLFKLKRGSYPSQLQRSDKRILAFTADYETASRLKDSIAGVDGEFHRRRQAANDDRQARVDAASDARDKAVERLIRAASAMSARSDETPQEAQSEGRQRDPKGDAQ